MTPKKTGQFITELRKGKGLTQEQLATKINVTNKAVSRWETGKGYPDVTSLMALGDYFNVSVNELLNGQRIEKEQIVSVAEKNVTAVLEMSEKNNDISKRTIKVLVSVIIVLIFIALCFVARGGIYAYNEIMGSEFCEISSDYSVITYYGQTYVQLKLGNVHYELGERIVKEASVEGSYFSTKLLFGDSIYSIEGCPTNDLIYLQSEYDYIESNLYCLKEKKEYYENLLNQLTAKKYFMQIESIDGTFSMVSVDNEFVKEIILNTKNLLQVTDKIEVLNESDYSKNLLIFSYGDDGIFSLFIGDILNKDGKYYWLDKENMPANYPQEYYFDEVKVYEIPEKFYSLLDQYFSYMYK